jgi:hypothetical protein
VYGHIHDRKLFGGPELHVCTYIPVNVQEKNHQTIPKHF